MGMSDRTFRREMRNERKAYEQYGKANTTDISEEMANLLPNSELIVLEEGTHTAPLEMPELLNDALEAFLRRQNCWPAIQD